jgi:hypothetical protein
MLRNPRVWLYAAGGWLILTGLTHTAAHVWTFVLENGIVGVREFAMNAMKQAQSTDPLSPSLWRLMRTFSLSFSLLLFFVGSANIILPWTRAPARTLSAFSLFCTVFWTIAFVPFAFIDPVIQPIIVSVVAVPLHALAYLTASQEAAETVDSSVH